MSSVQALKLGAGFGLLVIVSAGVAYVGKMINRKLIESRNSQDVRGISPYRPSDGVFTSTNGGKRKSRKKLIN